jgi:hypothetical protein
MLCPVCNTELHLELASGELVDPEAESRLQRWQRLEENALLEEVEHAQNHGEA